MANRTLTVTLVGNATSMQKAFQQGGQAAGGLQTSLKQVATLVGVGGFAVAMKRGIQASVQLATQFESSMTKITALVGVSKTQVDAWGRDILEMAPKLGKAPNELAEGLFFVTSAGLRGAEAMDVLESSAKASAVGLGETATIADLTTSAMNAYGSENLSASQATDILVNAVREGKAEASDMAAALGGVLPVASEMGVTFDQVAAATAAMTRTGTNAATASTQLRAILVGLLKPAQQAEDALAEMGTSSADMRAKIRDEGLLAALTDLREKTNLYGEDAMAKVFPNVRALAGTLDLLGGNAETNTAIFESLADSTGVLDDAFAVTAETAAFKFQQALAQLQVIGTEVGSAMLPMIISALEGVGPLLLGAGNAASSFMVGLGIIVDVVKSIPGPVKIAAAAIGLLVGALTLAIAHPIVAGLAAVAGVITLIGKSARDHQADVDAFVDAMTAVGEASDLVLDRFLAQKLAEADLIDLMREHGLTVDDVRGALELEEDALQKINDAFFEQSGRLGVLNEDGRKWFEQLGDLGEVYREAAAEVEKMEEAEQLLSEELGKSGETADQTADKLLALRVQHQAARDAAGEQTEASFDLDAALQDLDAVTEDMAEEARNLSQRLRDAEDAQTSLSEVLRAAADPVVDAIGKTRRYQDALTDLEEKKKDNTSTAGDLAQAELDVGLAALEAQEALDNMSGDVLEEALTAIGAATGKSKEEVVKLLEQLGILDGKEVTAILKVQAPVIDYVQSGNRIRPSVGQVLRLAEGGVSRRGRSAMAEFGEGADQEAVIPLNDAGVAVIAAAFQKAFDNARGRSGDGAASGGVQIGTLVLQGIPERIAKDTGEAIVEEIRWS